MHHDSSSSTESTETGSPPVEILFTQEFWDDRYGSAEQIWSGNPNPVLVQMVGDLEPGSALHVGCGEGGDAIWMAGHGWQVTGLDVSTVALERAARQAVAVSEEVAARLTWEQADIRKWDPAPRQFDFISSQFMHLPPPDRTALNQRLAAAVRPGGMFLVVGHDITDIETPVPRHHLQDLYFSAEEVAATLDPAEWEIRVAASLPREAMHEGKPVTLRDAVLCAVRRA